MLFGAARESRRCVRCALWASLFQVVLGLPQPAWVVALRVCLALRVHVACLRWLLGRATCACVRLLPFFLVCSCTLAIRRAPRACPRARSSLAADLDTAYCKNRA